MDLMAMAIAIAMAMVTIFTSLPIVSTSRQGWLQTEHSRAREIFSDRQQPDNSKLHYRNNLELEESLKLLTKRCQNITRLYSIGRSHMGFPLWVLEISDKPGELEAEPAFKYVGNLHGDEPVGRELLLLLANWLCDNYKKQSLATNIVNGLHLHLLPSMNPDGFQLRSRNNAKNIDLNRDFPDQFFPQNNNESLRQPETIAIMNWTRSNHFVASASLHGGAIVANYPWDGTADGRTKYSMCDDDKTFRHLAKIYSAFHANMSRSNEFSGGITNGAAWYPLYGGMQDWNYIHGQCMDLTLEITEDKWPLATEIENIWEQNRLSMLMLIASLLKYGIYGRVISSLDGRPLPASISVKGINFTVFASNNHGDYHRLLTPGDEYEVTARMPGYKTHTVKINVEEILTRLDFTLEPQILAQGQVSLNQSSGFQEKEDDEKDVDEETTTVSLFVKEKLVNNFTFRRQQLRVSSNGADGIAELVNGHLKTVSVSLMLSVLLVFALFVSRYRRKSKVQNSK